MTLIAELVSVLTLIADKIVSICLVLNASELVSLLTLIAEFVSVLTFIADEIVLIGLALIA